MRSSLQRLTRAATVMALLAASPGCSFIFVHPPRSTGRVTQHTSSGGCTKSKLAPAVDTAVGAFQVVRTGMALAADDSVYQDPNQPLSREVDITLGVGLTALFVGSAIYGFVNTSECKRRSGGDDVESAETEQERGGPRSGRTPPETWGPSPATVRPTATAPTAASAAPPAPDAGTESPDAPSDDALGSDASPEPAHPPATTP
jgi:hypothetical protein